MYSFLIKGTLIISLAALVALGLRRSSAARRHVVWLAAFGVLLLLPLAEIGLPKWNVAPGRARFVMPLVVPATFTSRPIHRQSNSSPTPVPATETSSTDTQPAIHPIDLPALLGNLWLVGFAASCGWLLTGLLRVWWLVRSSKPFLEEKVRLSQSLHVPAVAGFFRPIILLPDQAQEWDAERLRMVLAHEAGHIARRDWLWQLLAQLACSIHFFNPLVWIAAKRLRAESELACDDLVLRAGVEPTQYAETLLEIARDARYQLAATVGMASTPRIEGRLRSIVDDQTKRTSASTRMLTTVAAATLLVAVPVAVLHALPNVEAKSILPQIPWVASPEVEPNVFLAKDGVAGLPGGFRVKLVGLGTYRCDDVWGLDSGRLPDESKWRDEGVYWQQGDTFRYWYAMNSVSPVHRAFIVEIESDKDADVATTDGLIKPLPVNARQRSNPTSSGADDHIPSVKLTANQPEVAMIALGIPTRAETGTYRFAIAGPNWKTESVVDNPYHGDPSGIGKELAMGDGNTDACGITLGASPAFFWGDQAGNYHDHLLLRRGTIPTSNSGSRVILYDRSGHVIPLMETPNYDINGDTAIMLRAETFCRIARVEFQTSPYRWAEFRDVPLRPNFEADHAKALDPGIRGTATGIAPGFSKRLANGATVAIAAVTKATQEGDSWTFIGQPSWRADGQVLKDSPKIYEYSRPLVAWGKTPPMHIAITYGGKIAEADSWVLPTQNADPTAWVLGEQPPPNCIPGDLETTFLQDARSCGIRVGVANGPWKIVSRTPVSVKRLPDFEGTNPKPTGLIILMGDVPRLTTFADGRTRNLADHSIKGLSSRLVVEFKSGHKQVLMPTGTRTFDGKVSSFYDLPARQGEHPGGNEVLAGDIREIRLETRPYEWVEFKDIALEHK